VSPDQPTDWHAWHQEYDDPGSSLSRRLTVVREQLANLLADRRVGRPGPLTLLSLCAGDGRDTLPVLAATDAEVTAVLVELDPVLADAARASAVGLGLDVDVRTDDAGLVASWLDVVPVDVLLLCGVLGNISDDDVRSTLRGAALMLQQGGTVIWTRGAEGAGDDPSERVRELLRDAGGWEEVAFVKPDDASYRVGVHRWEGIAAGVLADRLFAFVS
jgi:hypothetical protein